MDRENEEAPSGSPFSVIQALPGLNPSPYTIAEVYMFDTCTHKCGYCWLAESGQVLDFAQLEPFKRPEFVSQIASFFVSRTSTHQKWLLQLTGGEPLICPNLDRLVEPVIEAGNCVAFNTALLVGPKHPGFVSLLKHSYPGVDYVMASLHPEAEADEERYFEKIRMLKDHGHRVCLRFVGQAARLGRLQELSDRCRQLDICFYPTTLLSDRYPAAYTEPEKDHLRRHFSSLSQYIQLEGGVDTSGLQCYGGSRVIAVNLQTGNITPCITVQNPSLGNIFEDRLELHTHPILCPDPGIGCVCDIHFQQNIILAVEDHSRFEEQLSGFTEPEDFRDRLAAMRENGLKFHSNRPAGIGGVVDDSRPFYSIDEIKENYRKNRGLPRTSLKGTNLREIASAVRLHDIQTANDGRIDRTTPVRIVTPEMQWWYAAAIPLVLPTTLNVQIWVRVRARILRGEGGFGVLSRDGTTFQDRGFLKTSEDSRTLFLKVENAADANSLIVQNSGADGLRAEILLEEVTVLAEPI